MTDNWSIVDRAKHFALRIIRLYTSLPKSVEAQVIGKQVLRSGTSVGAHIREGKRSRSDAEMISKIEVAQQELEETLYWLELLIGANLVEAERLTGLIQESNELIAILVTSSKTIKQRKRKIKNAEVSVPSTPHSALHPGAAIYFYHPPGDVIVLQNKRHG